MRFSAMNGHERPDPVRRIGGGGQPEDRKWSAILLAGTRAERDPLASHFGVPMKALVPIGGEPMIVHVVRTLLASPSVGRILILAQQPELLLGGALQWIAKTPRVEWAVSRGGIGESLGYVAGTEAAPWPLLITTADHPLLTVEMVEYFLRESSRSDCSLGVVDRDVLMERYPETRRTWLRFRGGACTGANLFSVRTGGAAPGLEVLADAETHRKNQLRLLWYFGPALALGTATRTLSLQEVVERGGRRFGLDAALVRLPFAEAGIDVDRLEDQLLADRILAARATASAPPPRRLSSGM